MSRNEDFGFDQFMGREKQFEKFKSLIEGRDVVSKFIEATHGRKLAARLANEVLDVPRRRMLQGFEDLESGAARRAARAVSMQDIVDRVSKQATIAGLASERAKVGSDWQARLDAATGNNFQQLLDQASSHLHLAEQPWEQVTGRDYIEQALRALSASDIARRAIEQGALGWVTRAHDFESFKAQLERALPGQRPLVRDLLRKADWDELEKVRTAVAGPEPQPAANATVGDVEGWQVDLEPLVAFLGRLMDRILAPSKVRKGKPAKVAIGLVLTVLFWVAKNLPDEALGEVLDRLFTSQIAASSSQLPSQAPQPAPRIRPPMVSDRPVVLRMGPTASQRVLAVVPPHTRMVVLAAQHGWFYVWYVDTAGHGAEARGWARAKGLHPVSPRTEKLLACQFEMQPPSSCEQRQPPG